MMTEEQAEQIKEQLLKQLENFPEDQREQVKEKIVSMTTEEVEEFVKQNQLTHLEKEGESPECIFCNIASKKISSYILEEDKENLAVLEINPLSKGHAMIIPKKHIESGEISKTSIEMARRVATTIQKRLKPKEIKVTNQKILNHSLIDILPIYGTETERKKATEEELIELQRKLKEEEKPKIQENPIPVETTKIREEIPKFKPRMP